MKKPGIPRVAKQQKKSVLASMEWDVLLVQCLLLVVMGTNYFQDSGVFLPPTRGESSAFHGSTSKRHVQTSSDLVCWK